VITSPLNFRIHGYPDDYWRMTPNCLRRMLSCYAARVTGSQGHRSFPHSVMGVGIRAPAPADVSIRARKLIVAYRDWLRLAQANLPVGTRLRRALQQLYRSKGERFQIADYYAADFTVDVEPYLARAG